MAHPSEVKIQPAPDAYQSGKCFDRLTIVRVIGRTANHEKIVECLCKCGNITLVRADHLRRGDTRSCGCLNREASRGRSGQLNKFKAGKLHPSWKGGRKLKRKGYLLILSPEHPRAQHDGYVFEHRLVMERVIGRYLTPDEVVHHKNGDKHDNRPENLELWTKSHPSGQRVEDVVAWAKDILKRYKAHATN